MLYLFLSLMILIMSLELPIKAIYSDGRIDSLEKFCEKIPFMRMALKDDRMCKCS